MFLTTKGRYAVMAMVDLVVNDNGYPQKLLNISARQGIDIAYLEQIFAKLKGVGLVQSFRGPGGGYKLLKTKEEINIMEIMSAVEEPMRMTRCNNKGPNGCAVGGKKCSTHELWAALESKISGFLGSISLADVCNQKLDQCG